MLVGIAEVVLSNCFDKIESGLNFGTLAIWMEGGEMKGKVILLVVLLMLTAGVCDAKWSHKTTGVVLSVAISSDGN